MTKRVIIIMAKVPRAGNVKTRLAPILNTEQRRTLAEAFLADAIFKARNVADALVVAYAHAGEKKYFTRFKVENMTAVEQSGANLGARMSRAFDGAFAEFPAANVVLIGTDSPTFPPEFFEKSFAALDATAEIVLGAAADGGFYLIGLRKNQPQLFERIEWSTAAVYRQITRRAAKLNLALHTIPDWYDVDTPVDLENLRREIFAADQVQKIAPQTFRWLAANRDVF